MTRFFVIGALACAALAATVWSLLARSPRLPPTRVEALEWSTEPPPTSAEVALVSTEGPFRFTRERVGDVRSAVIEHDGKYLRAGAHSWSVVRHDGEWWWAVEMPWAINKELWIIVSDDGGKSWRRLVLPHPLPGSNILGSVVAGPMFALELQGGEPTEPWRWAKWLPVRRTARTRLVTRSGGASWRLEF